MAARRDARLIRHLRLDANDQVRISGLLGDQERVDPSGLAHECATLVVTPSAMGLRKARLAAPVRCQYSLSPTTKSKHVFSGGEHNDGGVAGLCPNLNDLVLGFDNAQHRPAVLSEREGKRRVGAPPQVE